MTVESEEKSFDNSSLDWFSRSSVADRPAILVGVYTNASEAANTKEHLHELKLLAETHGISVIQEVAFSMRTFSAATFISQGKLTELKSAVDAFGSKLVIFDDDISPAQQRNLEQFLQVPVIDRAQVILGVFADRAKTKEARLQIELAQLKYIAPRLKRMWTHFSKQAGGGGGSGGGGYTKGEGEKQIEIDRRILKDKQEKLTRDIREVKNTRTTQRAQRERSEIPVFAIVGYTNAGKSTLMNKLTDADVFVEDKLFATLDTTTRKFQLPDNKQDLLLIDTVGFIRKLPHHLVMAFRSTLEESVHSDVLLHVVDASHPMALQQAETTLKVLKELEAGDAPVITILNKMDRVHASDATAAQKEAYQKLRLTYPRAIELSAVSGEGIEALFVEMKHVLQKNRVRMHLCIPQSDYQFVSEAQRLGKVYEQQYDNNDVILDVDLPIHLSYRYAKYQLPK